MFPTKLGCFGVPTCLRHATTKKRSITRICNSYKQSLRNRYKTLQKLLTPTKRTQKKYRKKGRKPLTQLPFSKPKMTKHHPKSTNNSKKKHGTNSEKYLYRTRKIKEPLKAKGLNVQRNSDSLRPWCMKCSRHIPTRPCGSDGSGGDGFGRLGFAGGLWSSGCCWLFLRRRRVPNLWVCCRLLECNSLSQRCFSLTFWVVSKRHILGQSINQRHRLNITNQKTLWLYPYLSSRLPQPRCRDRADKVMGTFAYQRATPNRAYMSHRQVFKQKSKRQSGKHIYIMTQIALRRTVTEKWKDGIIQTCLLSQSDQSNTLTKWVRFCSCCGLMFETGYIWTNTKERVDISKQQKDKLESINSWQPLKISSKKIMKGMFAPTMDTKATPPQLLGLARHLLRAKHSTELAFA